MNDDLNWIKRYYGESMMRICRQNFPKLLEFEGVLPELLSKHFYGYRNLAQDLIDQGKVGIFKAFIFSCVDVEKEEIKINADKTAIELMKEAGYTLYPECQTEADIQSFRHYYYREDGKTPVYIGGKPEFFDGEEICTFNGGRLNTCRVWFAVKHNADALKREDFKKPSRQDEYGTSVISIQFTKDRYSTLSIPNRYNHHVNNSDNTFDSNLDNIIEGLSGAFERDYGVRDRLVTKIDLDLDNYVLAKDGKYYPYNYKINNTYYCPNNIVIDNGEVKQLPSHQILADYFIIDCKEKTLKLHDYSIKDSFVDGLEHFEKVEANKSGEIKITKLNGQIVNLKINKKGQITAVDDEGLTKCGDCYLSKSTAVENLNLPNVEICGHDFMKSNNAMTSLSMASLKECGNNFLYLNKVLLELYLPLLEKCGNNFACYNRCMKELDVSNLRECGNSFCLYNDAIIKLYLPYLQKCGTGFFCFNKTVEEVTCSELLDCGNDFFYCNNIMTKFYAPKVQKCGDNFMMLNNALLELYFPDCQRCGVNFMKSNQVMTEFYGPQLKHRGSDFFQQHPNFGLNKNNDKGISA